MSTLKNTEPTLERWRGGLDTLLIFVREIDQYCFQFCFRVNYLHQVGLFSAIITSFLVESLKNLEPDAGLRTNELLANLTGIIIAISTLNDTGLESTQPASFVPTSSDVRINIYWSLALIISVHHLTFFPSYLAEYDVDLGCSFGCSGKSVSCVAHSIRG